MNPYESSDSAAHDLTILKAEMKEWAFGIRCVFVVINLLPLYYCTRLLLAAPRFESIFEDMLGSKQKLPVLTRVVLEHCLLILGAVWLLAALMFVLIFVLRRARYVWITAAASALTMIITGHLVATVLVDPLVVVIQNLSGGGE